MFSVFINIKQEKKFKLLVRKRRKKYVSVAFCYGAVLTEKNKKYLFWF